MSDDHPAGRSAKSVRPFFILSHPRGTEVDGVIDIIRRAGYTVERWNASEFPARQAMTLNFNPPHWSTGKRVRSINYSAGWIHSWTGPAVNLPPTGIEREVSIRESVAVTEGLVGAISCHWLNAPITVRTASNKPLQLIEAQKLGCPIPRTIVSNDPVEIASFRDAVGSLVIKNIATGYLECGDAQIKFYTKRLSRSAEITDAALQVGPVLLQEEIDRAIEVRVSVVDGKCFSTAIDCRDLPQGTVDARELDFESEKWRFSKAPQATDIEAKSIRLTERLNLSFAGLDWLITKDGRPFFLECNPTPSFLWYEMCSGHPISAKIAEALITRSSDANQV